MSRLRLSPRRNIRTDKRICSGEMPQMQIGRTAEPCLFQENKEKCIGYKPVYHREN